MELILMNLKEKYIEDINNRFNGKTKELLLNHINLFYDDASDIFKSRYNVGEEVSLTKGTFIHGIFGELDNFDFTVDNGFIAVDFTEEPRKNKICNSVGMWNIKEDIYLKDYINLYSGFTITYSIGRGPEATLKSELIPYHKFDEVTEKSNDEKDVYIFHADDL